MKYDEKRAFVRVDIDSEMSYRLVDSNEFNSARCSSLSGSGMSFIAPQVIDVGKALEIHIAPKNSITPALTAFVEIVRVAPLANGEYEIATIIKTIKG